MLNSFKTILSQKTQLNSDTYLYHFNLLEPREINFKAGQYLMIKIPTNKGPISRLYSIASSSLEKNTLEFIIQIFPGGIASSYLFNLKINDAVVFHGPAGMFGLKKNNRPKIFLVTGTGIAPVRSMLESYQLPVSSYQLFWGMKTYKDVYLFDKLKEFNPKICLSREQNLDIIPENDKKYFELGHVDSCFDQYIENCKLKIENLDFYLCGGRLIVESLKQFLLNKNICSENIYFEKF